MPSPFPGMDPYLESPTIWPDVHHRLISAAGAALTPHLRPRYVARVELRAYSSDDDDPGRTVLVPDIRVEEGPKRKAVSKSGPGASLAIAEPLIVPTLMDEEIEEAFLKIVHVESKAIVAVIEVLSPANKIRGSRGRVSFMAKRREILDAEVHWVEIDLLRAGVPSVTDPPLRASDYRILMSRGDQRMRTRYWPVSVRQPLPVIEIPLRGKEPGAPLDLAGVLTTIYDQAAYDMTVDYRKEPEPPLAGDDAKWARDLLRRRK